MSFPDWLKIPRLKPIRVPGYEPEKEPVLYKDVRDVGSLTLWNGEKYDIKTSVSRSSDDKKDSYDDHRASYSLWDGICKIAEMEVASKWMSTKSFRLSELHSTDEELPGNPDYLIDCASLSPPAFFEDEDKPITLVQELNVRENYRKKDLGSALLKVAHMHGQKHGDRFMGLAADNGSCPFYEKNGFERVCYCYKGPIPESVKMYLPPEKTDFVGRGGFKELSLGDKRIQSTARSVFDDRLGIRFEIPVEQEEICSV